MTVLGNRILSIFHVACFRYGQVAHNPSIHDLCAFMGAWIVGGMDPAMPKYGADGHMYSGQNPNTFLFYQFSLRPTCMKYQLKLFCNVIMIILI